VYYGAGIADTLGRDRTIIIEIGVSSPSPTRRGVTLFGMTERRQSATHWRSGYNSLAWMSTWVETTG
jgi:hypothetical protein